MSNTETFVTNDVWDRIIANYAVGQKIVRPIGKVIPPLGVFVNIEPDFDGLIHISRIIGLNGRDPRKFFFTGQIVSAEIVVIDLQRRCVQLATKLPIPSKAEAAIRNPSPVDVDVWIEQHPKESQSAASFVLGDLVIPTLGLVWPIAM